MVECRKLVAVPMTNRKEGACKEIPASPSVPSYPSTGLRTCVAMLDRADETRLTAERPPLLLLWKKPPVYLRRLCGRQGTIGYCRPNVFLARPRHLEDSASV